MATSGYLFVSSFAPLSTGSGYNMTNNSFQVVHTFGAPLDCGTVTHIDVLAYKNGTPSSGSVRLFVITQQSLSAAIGQLIYIKPDFNYINCGTILAATLNQSSVTATQVNSAQWIRCPVDTPFYLSNAPYDYSIQSAHSTVPYYESCALSKTFILLAVASANNDPTNAIVFPTTRSWDTAFGRPIILGVTAISANSANESAGFLRWQDIGFGLYGLTTVSTRYKDRSAGKFTVGSGIQSVYFFTAGSIWKAGGVFWATGSAITRARMTVIIGNAGQTIVQGNAYYELWDDSAGNPGSVVGTSNIFSFDGSSQDGAENDSFTYSDNISSIAVAPAAIFSTPVNVTSGNRYWLMLRANSFANNFFKYATRFIQQNSAFGIVYTNPSSVNTFVTKSGGQPQFEVWYQDSGTLAEFSNDYPVLLPYGQIASSASVSGYAIGYQTMATYGQIPTSAAVNGTIGANQLTIIVGQIPTSASFDGVLGVTQFAGQYGQIPTSASFDGILGALSPQPAYGTIAVSASFNGNLLLDSPTGGYARKYPTIEHRKYPELINRKYPV